jgi:hypothetical protein
MFFLLLCAERAVEHLRCQQAASHNLAERCVLQVGEPFRKEASLARQTNHSKIYQPPGAGASWNARRHGLKCPIFPLFNADPVGLKAEGIRFTYGLVDKIWLDWLGSLALIG